MHNPYTIYITWSSDTPSVDRFLSSGLYANLRNISTDNETIYEMDADEDLETLEKNLLIDHRVRDYVIG